MSAPPTGTVLSMDEDEVVRDSLKALLGARNFATGDFPSCQDFLARRDGTRPGCLILDIHMPEMTGLDLLAKLRGKGDRIPAILITGRRESTSQAQADALGAVALLDKAISHPCFFAAITSAFAA